MIICLYGINHLGGLPKVQSFSELYPVTFRQEIDKRSTSADSCQKVYMAHKRGFSCKIFEKRKAFWSKTKEKKALRRWRNTFIISLVEEVANNGKR